MTLIAYVEVISTITTVMPLPVLVGENLTRLIIRRRNLVFSLELFINENGDNTKCIVDVHLKIYVIHTAQRSKYYCNT
jgi:hypothetical protein